MPVVTEGLPLAYVLSPSDHIVPVYSYLSLVFLGCVWSSLLRVGFL